MELKAKLSFLVLTVLCYNTFNSVCAKPNTPLEPLIPLDNGDRAGKISDKNLTRIARQSDCSHKGGCYRGYCWAGCTSIVGSDLEWCYTTRGSSQDRGYIKCSEDTECSKCWKCAGPCAAL